VHGIVVLYVFLSFGKNTDEKVSEASRIAVKLKYADDCLADL